MSEEQSASGEAFLEMAGRLPRDSSSKCSLVVAVGTGEKNSAHFHVFRTEEDTEAWSGGACLFFTENGRLLPFHRKRDNGILKDIEGVDLVPSDIGLSSFEMSLVNIMSREFVLRSYLGAVKRDYDYVLADTMSHLTRCGRTDIIKGQGALLGILQRPHRVAVQKLNRARPLDAVVHARCGRLTTESTSKR